MIRAFRCLKSKIERHIVKVRCGPVEGSTRQAGGAGGLCAVSKSGQTAYGLFSEFLGTLVCDGASNFNPAVNENKLKVALCNDHARRRFKRVFDQLCKEDKKGAAGSVAAEGVHCYKALYKIEKEIRSLSVGQKVAARQQEALPLWKSLHALENLFLSIHQ